MDVGHTGNSHTHTHIHRSGYSRLIRIRHIYVMFISAWYILQMGLFLPLFMPSVKSVCLYQIGRYKFFTASRLMSNSMINIKGLFVIKYCITKRLVCYIPRVCKAIRSKHELF